MDVYLQILVFSSDDEERLMVDVFRGYNSLIPPIRNLSEMPIIVKIAMQLFLLIDVAEKDQVMHTNVWLTLRWHDFQMRWNPVNYGEIKEMRVSPDKVWLPDIVLFNNCDGNFEVSFMCNVVINYHGDMLWVPPAIYKSSCIIDVEYFPFDEQVCTLVFGSWTYNENEIKLGFDQAELVDLSEYEPRKTLFYTIILIIPTFLMGSLNLAVFFLPTDSGEKMTLIISIMLSIVVFLLLVSKILPPTSSTIPLLAKYLLLTFVLNVITILITIIIINIYFRSPTTHPMPEWVRSIFLEWMPLLMCLQRPKSASRKLMTKKKRGATVAKLPGVGQFPLNRARHHPLCPSADDRYWPNILVRKSTDSDEYSSKKAFHYLLRTVSIKVLNCGDDIPKDPGTIMFYPLSPDALRAIDAIEYITDHIVQEKEYKIHCDDWKFVGMIIDRLLLYVFFGITAGGTCGILFSAPSVFEGRSRGYGKNAPTYSESICAASNINVMLFYQLLPILFILLFVRVHTSEDEERLMVDIFRGYNSLIQPIRNVTTMPIIVKIALQLVLLINVDEKDQVMHTNVWLTLKWHDFQMRWNPVNYGEIKEMRVSPDKVWLPDIVLFNNADGNYEVSFMCNVVINYHGDMLWVPPAIYKSSCIIDVEFFPFDEQVCTLVFGSWTYNENEIKLEFEQAEWVDLSEYAPSSIWDLMDAPASLVNKRSRIEFQVRIRYLLLTFVLNVITILVTVIIINVYFRSPTTHRMPSWVRTLFLEWMPCIMCMQRPKSASRKLMASQQKRGVAQLPGIGQFTFNPASHHPFCP
ncbi:unnamed protein product, partial [Haemonchus placei]|uniref:Neur_chan_LBD domain-containing protein n=1 Tax=Haemonchus placei TaxID=6290 RepID=A0A158QRR3_HAEPC